MARLQECRKNRTDQKIAAYDIAQAVRTVWAVCVSVSELRFCGLHG